MKMRKYNDYSYLLKDKNLQGTNISDSLYLHDVYLSLLTEFFKEFGQTKSFKDEIKIKSEILDVRLEFSSTGDKFLLNDLSVLEQKLLSKQADNIDKEAGVDGDIEDKKMIAKVSKSLGMAINIKTLSVVSFYTQLTIQEVEI